MKIRTLALAGAISVLVSLAPDRATGQVQQGSRDEIAALISAISYGVPTSPAFALLPDQPTEVTHLVTPHDFQAAVSSWMVDGALRTGAAFDVRPFSQAGSLTEYQLDPVRQIQWRSVVSAGTAPASPGSSDVVLALGLRIPVIDRSDPRANRAFVNRLESAYVAALRSLGPPPLNATDADFAARADSAAKLIQPLRDTFQIENWNKLKWDVGIGLAARARGGELNEDSVFSDRAGFWTAVALPLGRSAQGTASLKLSWARADSVGGESARHVLGGRVRLFPRGELALSGEAARVWTNHREQDDLDESWNHIAVVLEFPTTFFGTWLDNGWMSIAYGGDVSRRGNPGARLSFQYAIYQDKLLKR